MEEETTHHFRDQVPPMRESSPASPPPAPPVGAAAAAAPGRPVRRLSGLQCCPTRCSSHRPPPWRATGADSASVQIGPSALESSPGLGAALQPDAWPHGGQPPQDGRRPWSASRT
ncbi:hypothetical protein QJS66_03350 [Kocuria rhizophila]|nr:hypothetical protein QJS66_03350 [Kocuria rhizophila]